MIRVVYSFISSLLIVSVGVAPAFAALDLAPTDAAEVEVASPILSEDILSEESLPDVEMSKGESVAEVEEELSDTVVSEAVSVVSVSVAEPVVLVVPKSESVPELSVPDVAVMGVESLEVDVSKATVSNEELPYVPNEVLVVFKDDALDMSTRAGTRALRTFATHTDLVQEDAVPEGNMALFTIDDEQSVEAKIAEVERHPQVAYAEPNYRRVPTLITNDTHRDALWGLHNSGQTVGGTYAMHNPGVAGSDIDASLAWSINEGTESSVIVAVIDNGVAYNHPDLAPQMWDGSACVTEDGGPLGGCVHGYDFADNDRAPLPVDGIHGTHVAGTIAAAKDNTLGIIGVAPRAKIMALRFGLDIASEVRAIDFARQNGARVINASYGGPFFSQAEFDAIKRFEDAGGIFVAAAGNQSIDGDVTPSYPANHTHANLIAVAATDQSDTLASFSNYGPMSVDVGAPGTNILSTAPGETTGLFEPFDVPMLPSLPLGWNQAGVGSNWGVVLVGSSWGTALFPDLSYPYQNNAETTLTAPIVPLGTNQASLNFWAACDTEYSVGEWTDYMQLEWSADGINFVVAEDPYFGGPFRFDEATFDFLRGFAPDASGGVSFFYEDVPIPGIYATDQFTFRFRWVTNEADNEHFGCFIDDVYVAKMSDGSDEQYAYLDGTSMATPHVAGLAALLLGYKPSLTNTQAKDLILTTGDSIPDLQGKTVSGKRINAANALSAVQFPKAITAFSVSGQIGASDINDVTSTISATVPFGTDIAALAPTITTTSQTSVSPASGVSQNFTQPVAYTVTAIDGTTRVYTVTVSIAPQPSVVSSGGGGGGGGGGSSKQYAVAINGKDKKTTTESVMLTLTSAKAANQMRISNTANFTNVSWVPYKKTIPWTLASGSGNKTVYVQYGKNGKVVKEVKDNITLVAKQSTPSTPSTVNTSPTPLPSTAGQKRTTPPKETPRQIFTRDLSVGSTGSDVLELQKILIKAGYLKIAQPTTYFGQLTKAALVAYQKSRKLTATGTVDKATRASLNGSVSP